MLAAIALASALCAAMVQRPANLGSAGAGSFSPSDISGLKLWLKADALALSDGDKVGTWTDSSSAANNATASGTDRPTYKTGIVNSKPSVRFTSANSEHMATGSNVGISGNFAATVFVVTKPTSSSVAMCPVGMGNTGVDKRFSLVGAGVNSGKYSVSYGSGDWWNDTTTVDTAAFHTICIKKSAGAENTTTTIYKDGTAGSNNGSSDTATPNLTDAPVALGTLGADIVNSNYDGDIAEVIIYDTALSDGNRNSVEGYLRTKYGTP